jgi:type IV pilus assembly protein PilW
MFNKPLSFQGSRCQPRTRQLHKGFTLVELMVSMTIGLVLVLSMLVLYTNIARNQAQLGNTSRQVENGKFALQILQDDLRHAGFWGDYLPRFDDRGVANPEDVPNALPNPCLAYSSANWTAAYTRNLMGISVHGDSSASGTVFSSECNTLLTNRANVTNVPTDVLMVRYADNCTTGQPNCDAETAGRLYFQSSRCAQEIAAGNRFVLNTTGLTLKSNIKCVFPAAVPPVVPPDTIAGKRRLVSNIYYVRSFSVTAGDGIPTLMRSSFNLEGTTLAHRTPEPLIDGIEAFRVEYGIDNIGRNGAAANYNLGLGAINRGDGVPDVYITCPKSGGTACNVGDMFHVVSARIHVLARNIEPTPGHTDTKTYVLAGTPYGPFDDRFIRRAYSTTVRLMNPAGRREP